MYTGDVGCLRRCEEDADLQIDRVGAPVACGGLCAVLRDWGRFGLCLAHDGRGGLTESGDQLQVKPRCVESSVHIRRLRLWCMMLSG
jgi:hypothetical protein